MNVNTNECLCKRMNENMKQTRIRKRSKALHWVSWTVKGEVDALESVTPTTMLIYD